jgi:hypothetical protein
MLTNNSSELGHPFLLNLFLNSAIISWWLNLPLNPGTLPAKPFSHHPFLLNLPLNSAILSC